MALGRIKRPEHLRQTSPGELGKVIGLPAQPTIALPRPSARNSPWNRGKNALYPGLKCQPGFLLDQEIGISGDQSSPPDVLAASLCSHIYSGTLGAVLNIASRVFFRSDLPVKADWHKQPRPYRRLPM